MTWKREGGRTRVFPSWEKGPDGGWRIMHLDTIKAMLSYEKEKNDKGKKI
jgi:hypothetical protein